MRTFGCRWDSGRLVSITEGSGRHGKRWCHWCHLILKEAEDEMWDLKREERSCHNIGSVLDYFTLPLHSPNSKHLPAVRAVQRDCHWLLKNGWNSIQSQKPTMLCNRGNPNLYFNQPNTKGWCQLIGGHCQSFVHKVRAVQQSMSVTWRGKPMRDC